MTSRTTTTGASETAAVPKTQRYGHLELGFTSRLKSATAHSTAPGVYNPLAPDSSGWRSLGTVFCDPTDPVLMVKDHSPQGDLLKNPSRFDKLGTFTSPIWGYTATVWRPVPPSGDYVAMGIYITPESTSPSLGDVVCVKKNHSGRAYARHGELSHPLSSLAPYGYLRYNVTPLYPHADTEEHLILPTGTLSYAPWGNIAPGDTAWLLDLPAVVEKFDGPDTPDLENHNPPPPLTMITDRAVIVPFYLVTDPSRTAQWKAANSPFYKILRKRQFTLVRHVDYRSQGGGQISETIEQGVSREKSEEFSQTTGITVGVAVGVEASAKVFGVGASTTVTSSVSTSIETGYSSRYGVTTMTSKTVGVTYDVPAGHAGALWSESHELIPVRADDSMITNANLKFDSGSYVGRTYPYSDQPPPQVTALTPAQAGEAPRNLWEIADQLQFVPAEPQS
jgi:hypothetical protein